jgi:HEAT repeat protein
LRSFALPVLVLAFALSVPAPAQEEPAPTAAELLAREKVRAEFDSVMAYLRSPDPPVEGSRGKFYVASEKLVQLGPAAGPFLADEIAKQDGFTYNIVTYVLGRLRAPGAAETLRKAIAEDEKEEGKFAAARKEWASYGLALAGDPQVVEIVATGTHDVSWMEFMEGVRLHEAVAVLTAPGSIPILAAQLERFSKEESQQPKLDFVLSALGRIGDPANVPHVLPFLTHSRWQARRAAAKALGRLGDPSVAPKLMAALDDANREVRFAAAAALLELKPKDQLQPILARLEVEKEPVVRADLYRTLAHIGGEGLLEAFRGYAARPNLLERLGVADALGILRSRKGVNLLREQLRDPDVGVVVRAMASLEIVGGGGATDTLLALLSDTRWPVQETAIETLERMREPRAAPRIAELLLKQELSANVAEAGAKVRLQKMGETLLDLRYTELLPDLKEAARLQTEPQIVAYLDGLVRRMEALAENQDSVPKWVAAAGSSDRLLRQLAYSRLGDLATPEAMRALAAAFDKADLADGVEVLRAVGRSRSAEGGALVERVLTDPSFDAFEKTRLRTMAAWAARQIGGEPMSAALRRSAERREGQELETLEYLALLDGKAALPTLRASRVPRLRVYEWFHGKEMDRLDWMIREIAAGRPIDVEVDHPPETIDLR